MNLAIQEGRAAGMMTIPLDWQDGVYDFVAYTVSNTQQVNKTIVGLPIYDDFKTYKSLNVPSQVVKTNEYIKGNVTTGQPKYQRKNTITGNLDFSSNANGRLSISVVQNTPNDIAAIFGKKESIKNFKANTNFETSNTVYAKIEKTALPNLLGVGIQLENSDKLIWVNPNEEGVIEFLNTTGQTQLAQIFGLYSNSKRKTYTIPLKVNKVNFLDKATSLTENKLEINDYIKTYLRQSQQRKKYQTIFKVVKPTFASLTTQESITFQPDETFKIADYASMLTLEEFLQEVVPFVKIKSKKKGRQVRLFNEKKEYSTENPVYIIDGWITHDQKAVFDIPISEVESVDIFRVTANLKTQFGKLGEYGVIGINTTKRNKNTALKTASNAMKVIGLSGTPTFKTNTTSFNKVPDFRSTIYWNSSIELKNGKASFSFPHSDDLGEFTIIVNGMTTDGKLLKATGNYTVE